MLSQSDGTIDNDLGQRFFRILSGVLLVLALTYIALHILFHPATAPISASLVALTTQAEEQARASDMLSASTELSATVAEIRVISITTLADKPGGLQANDKQAINSMIGRLDQAIAQNNQSDLLARLGALKRIFATPAPQSFLWSQEPWRFLEILLWGVAGVVIHQIIASARYLRYRNFYREGIVLNIAQMITIPIVALVAVLLLSLITLKITISGGNEVQLDLGDPRILAAFSFLIGLNFWKAWDFLLGVSDHIPGFERPSAAAPGKDTEPKT
jgi:hypothetical protein